MSSWLSKLKEHCAQDRVPQDQLSKVSSVSVPFMDNSNKNKPIHQNIDPARVSSVSVGVKDDFNQKHHDIGINTPSFSKKMHYRGTDILDTVDNKPSQVLTKEEGLVSPESISYKLITNIGEAKEALEYLAEKGELVGFDLETTGLSSHEGAKARLLQISPLKGSVLVIDLFRVGGLEALRKPLQKLKAVAHNAVFEMKFLKAAGINMTLDCTLLAGHVLTGEMAKLYDLCKTHLGVELDKTEQVSDWSGDLTTSQLSYAAADAYYVRLLFLKLQAELESLESMNVYKLGKNAQRAVVDMELTGMPFDEKAHQILLEKLTTQRETYQNSLVSVLGEINLNSGKQLGDWLTKVLGVNLKKWPKTPKGQLATSERDFRKGLKLLPKPEQELIANDFLPYKITQKQISSFGESLKKVISRATGRIHASFKMAGTKTGRFSCNNPNLQQIPRDKEFRALFKAPPGRQFVIADYSQMELRVAAIIANEEKLLEAYRCGKDTHTITAAMLLGKNAADVTKTERQLAKAVNFGLLYGQGAKGLKDYASGSYGVTISLEEATKYREAWFKAYPAFAAWHRKTAIASYQTMSVKTPMGRKRCFIRSQNEDYYSATKAYNTPVQGGAAEVMLAALGKLPGLLADLDAKPIAVIHDEVIVETSEANTHSVVKALEQAMVEGMLEVFPNASTLDLVEAKVVSSWAEK